MKPYSQDLRERIIAALETGTDSQSEIAATFPVSLSFVEKLWRKWRKTGNCDALPKAGGRERSLKNDESKIHAAVAAQPDLTLAELRLKSVGRKSRPPYARRKLALLKL